MVNWIQNGNVASAIKLFERFTDNVNHVSPNADYCSLEDVSNRHTFCKSDLRKCVDGLLFGPGNAQLPSSPLLMLDRIVDIQSNGGDYQRGFAVAELDIRPGSWFFEHHFRGDPLMPGCLLMESLWQLTGFYLAWTGQKGKGRVLDSGKTRFVEPINEKQQTLNISIHVRKVLTHDGALCIADGSVTCAGRVKCSSKAIKVGLLI